MSYKSVSLNGAWEMSYNVDEYKGKECPSPEWFLIDNAVPGYWEDMVDSFWKAPFYGDLRVNPEYGVQKYPMACGAPDMALPNIMGNFYYKKTVTLSKKDKVNMLHFEGVQNSVSIWVNDEFLLRHEGYSAPFDVEIPEDIIKEGENTVTLSVSNYAIYGYEGEPIIGITNRAASTYTGGITGDVELRIYNSPLRDAYVFVSDDLKTVKVNVETSEKCKFTWKVMDGKTEIKSGKAEESFEFSTEGLSLWSPENPKRYELLIESNDGKMSRKFGVKSLRANGVNLTLNKKPYFLRGVCEHCYYPETVNPTHDIAFYKNVIRTLKELGFNFIRFHTYVPVEEFMEAADELGIILHIESPNNTTLKEWEDIVRFCRRHVSVAIYCCGNELLLDDEFIDHLKDIAAIVHKETDSLFSPHSALRGVEYGWKMSDYGDGVKETPFMHNPKRMETLSTFCDVYNSFSRSHLSYETINCDYKLVDSWSEVYNKPRLSHEICITGTYTDLSLKDRYKGTRIGDTVMFTSLEKHLEDKGVLEKAPLYFKNSCEWQRRIRKYCFESARLCQNMAGYDFLGPIDTHWHTFGYDVRMMNEFYEIKPGETVRNVLMYNSETVLLSDIRRNTNYVSGDSLNMGIYTSCYQENGIENASLDIYFMVDGKVKAHENILVEKIESGKVSKLSDFSFVLPEFDNAVKGKVYVTLRGGEVFSENEWEVYVFPKINQQETKIPKDVVVSEGMTAKELEKALSKGKKVLLLGTEAFDSIPTTFGIALAGRTVGNLATVINDHASLKGLPHEGFCGWQFNRLMEEGNAVKFDRDDIPFNPIIEVVSSHKNVIKQAALFEFNAFGGKLLVCGFNFREDDPAAAFLKAKLIEYVQSDEFDPKDTLTKEQFESLTEKSSESLIQNTNVAFNKNDKTAVRRKKELEEKAMLGLPIE